MAKTIPASDFGRTSPENLGSVISKRASAIFNNESKSAQVTAGNNLLHLMEVELILEKGRKQTMKSWSPDPKQIVYRHLQAIID